MEIARGNQWSHFENLKILYKGSYELLKFVNFIRASRLAGSIVRRDIYELLSASVAFPQIPAVESPRVKGRSYFLTAEPRPAFELRGQRNGRTGEHRAGPLRANYGKMSLLKQSLSACRYKFFNNFVPRFYCSSDDDGRLRTSGHLPRGPRN